LPPDISDSANACVHRVMTSVEFRGESWVEGTFGLEAFYDRLEHEREWPRTSQPSPGEFLTAYETALGVGPVLTIVLSSQLSSTYSTGVAIAREFGEGRVTVYDSGFFSAPQGYMVAEAAELAAAGRTVEEIVTRLEWRKARTRLFFTLNTLEYLRRGGRINLLQAGLAEWLDLKPILTVHDGKLVPAGRVRTRRRALEEVVTKTEEFGRSLGSNLWIAAMHGRAPEDAARLLEVLEQRLPVQRRFIGEIPASIALHGGPGVVGAMVTAAYDG
jgi:DegV family protein with EDD domain